MRLRGNSASHPSRRRPGRYLFLTLLLIALSAPAGMVFAREARLPYVVLFDQAAVSVPAQAMDPTLNDVLGIKTPSSTTDARPEMMVDGERVMTYLRQLSMRAGVRAIDDVYTNAVGGFAARLTAAQLRRISADPAVSAVLPDYEVDLGPEIAGNAAGLVRTTAKPAERVPVGVRRVGARTPRVAGLGARGRGVDADVAILDTGVQRNHPDLNVVGGFNCTSRNRQKWDDNNGHGTHVAGIVGALDNRFGVTGVAPGARLWSVKVLDGKGRGFMSWVVCGVDWVAAQRERGGRAQIEVANMSLTFRLPGSKDGDCGVNSHDTLHMAICRAVERGTVFVAAAGNESRNARLSRPAGYDEVITVSALADYDGRGGGRGDPSSCPYWTGDADDTFASFSNFGADVDLIAPGRCIVSTYTRGRYAWMSGTSMATPHVSGAAAIYRTMFPRANPYQVRMALMAVGRLDWRTRTDPDKTHERSLWIGQFRAAPDFSVSATVATASARPGENATIDVRITRIGGFDDRVEVGVEDAPRGMRVSTVVARRGAASLTVRLDDSVAPGRYTLTVNASAAGVVRSDRVTLAVTGDKPPNVARDTTPPRAPTVTMTARPARVDVDGLGVKAVHVGPSGTLWVRAGAKGAVLVNVHGVDRESGIAANVARVRAGSGWRATWIGASAEGALRLAYGASARRSTLSVFSINGAGLEGPATIGSLMPDGRAPRAVRWTSAPSGTDTRIRGSSFRLEWAGGADDGSGLAVSHVVARYRAGLNARGECRRFGFSPDGTFRLAASGSVERGLQPKSCYVWSVRTLDNVGNAAGSVVSGYVITGPRK